MSTLMTINAYSILHKLREFNNYLNCECVYIMQTNKNMKLHTTLTQRWHFILIALEPVSSSLPLAVGVPKKSPWNYWCTVTFIKLSLNFELFQTLWIILTCLNETRNANKDKCFQFPFAWQWVLWGEIVFSADPDSVSQATISKLNTSF